jgi:hypothetical protein
LLPEYLCHANGAPAFHFHNPHLRQNTKARQINGLLQAEAAIEQRGQEIHLTYRLVVRAHHTEWHHCSAILH